MNKTIKFAAAISNVKKADLIDFTKFDLIFAGNPHCYIRKNNPLKSPEDLELFLHKVKDRLDQVVLSLPICPLESDLEHIFKLLDISYKHHIHGVEVQSPGMAKKVVKNYPNFKVYFGSFANIYTHRCAKVMKDMGVVGGSYPFELGLDEIEYIKNKVDIETWLPVFGTFPISFSQYCYFNPQQKTYPFQCNYQCENGMPVEYGSKQKVMHRGRAIYSDKYLNMQNHIKMLTDKGFYNFRIEGLFMEILSLNEVVGIFKDISLRIISNTINDTELAKYTNKLEKSFSEGFCNGFYFNRAGIDYNN